MPIGVVDRVVELRIETSNFLSQTTRQKFLIGAAQASVCAADRTRSSSRLMNSLVVVEAQRTTRALHNKRRREATQHRGLVVL